MSRRVYEQKRLTLLEHQAATHPATVVGPAFAAAGAHKLWLFQRKANVEAVANTEAAKILLQGSPSDSGADWFTLNSLSTGSNPSATEALAETEPAGENVLAVASTTSFEARQDVYIQNADVKLGEWHQIASVVTDTSITLVDGLNNEQDSNSAIWNWATIHETEITLEGFRRIRCVFDHEGSDAADAHVHVTGILVPSLIG